MLQPDFDPVSTAERIINEVGSKVDVVHKLSLDSKSAFILMGHLRLLSNLRNETYARAGVTVSQEQLLNVCLERFGLADLENVSREVVVIDFSDREVHAIGDFVAFALQFVPLYFGADRLLARSFLTLNEASVVAGGEDRADLRTALEQFLEK